MYDGFTSDEITRFPSFAMDRSVEWRLPEPFETFFKRAVTEKRFFDRVRPYDFAERDMTFLRRKDTNVILYVPRLWENYHDEIQKWANKFFSASPSERPISIEHSSPANVTANPHVWVARSTELARHLTRNDRPFILFDGKENQRIRSGIRAIRWDQVGYGLRHAEAIYASEVAHRRATNVPTAKEKIPPTSDIWGGHPYIPPDQTQATIWVGDQRLSLQLVHDFPDARLRYTPEAGPKEGQPLTPRQKVHALRAIKIDLAELERKGKLLVDMSSARLDQFLHDPRWSSVVHERELEMRRALEDLERELAIDPVSGNAKKIKPPRSESLAPTAHITDRLEVGNPLIDIELELNVSDYLHLAAKNWEILQRENLKGNKSNRAGTFAEVMTVLMLQQEGWKVLIPRDRVTQSNGKPHSLQDFTRIKVRWSAHEGQKKPFETEVDCLALGPDNKFYVIEVKVSSQTKLSRSQQALREHLSQGGSIVNPDVRGVDARTPLIYPRYRVLTFDGINLETAVSSTNNLTNSMSRGSRR